MARFDPDGRTSVFNMLGGWEKSRATNQSDGTDPVSLGLLPAGADPSPSPPPIPISLIPPAPAMPIPAVEVGYNPNIDGPERTSFARLPPPEPAPYQQLGPFQRTPERFIDLDACVAKLTDEFIPLLQSDTERIMEILINAYERLAHDRVLSMRAEFLSTPSSWTTEVSSTLTSTELALVRPLQGTSPQEVPPSSAATQAEHLQPVLPAKRRRPKRLQHVPRPEAGEGTPTPSS